MRALKAFALICAFCVNVRVKAQPVWAGKTKKVIHGSDLTVSLAPGSLIDSKDAKTLHLVSGKVYVDTRKFLRVKSPFGTVTCESNCAAIFERQDNLFTVKGLRGDWVVHRLGDKREYAIHPGFQVSLGPVTDKGFAAMDFPLSLPWKPTVEEWAGLFPGKFTEFKSTLVKFRAVWRPAVETISRIHLAAAERTIASYDAKQAERRARTQAREREDQRLRQLFRKQNYLIP